jgi:hypothetical protein
MRADTDRCRHDRVEKTDRGMRCADCGCGMYYGLGDCEYCGETQTADGSPCRECGGEVV